MTILHSVLAELSWTFRVVRARKRFAALVVAIIAVSVAAWVSVGASALELLNATLPYGAPDRLMMVWSNLPRAGYARAPLSGPELNDIRRESRTLDGVAAIFPGTATLLEQRVPLQLRVATVTANIFDVLRVRPALGRSFDGKDEGPGNAATVILSWELWSSAFGADPRIIGRRIHLGGRPTEVVGVMPASLRMPFAPDANVPSRLDAWVPFRFDLRQSPRERYFIRLIARLADGVTPQDADRELRQFGAGLERRYAGYSTSGREVFGVPLRQDLRAPVLTSVLASLVGAALVLVMAFINTAGLFATRAAQTARDRAVRGWLGASPTRLWCSTALEVTLLVAVGTAGGTLLGWLVLRVLRSSRPASLERIDEAGLTLSTSPLLFAVVAVLGVLLAVAAASAVSRQPAVASTRQTTAPASARLRAALVLLQVVVAVSLMVAATLWGKATRRVLASDVGFDPRGAITLRYSVASVNLATVEAADQVHRRLADTIAAIRGVVAVGTISHLPFDQLPNWSMAYYATPGDPGLAREADVRPVSPGLLKAIGGRLVEGRFFTDADDLRSLPVVVVDRRLAERTWPGRSALGQRLVIETSAGRHAEMTIVGVVEHLRHRVVDAEVREQLYLPVRQFVSGPTAMIVRSTGDPNALVDDIRAAAARVDERLPLWDFRPLTDYYDEASAERRFAALLLAAFAAHAILLVALGLFGLLASVVESRRHEFGVRLAVGATPWQLLRSVLRQAVLLIATGAAAGLLLGSLGGRGIAEHLYGVSPHDGGVLAFVVLLVVSVGLLASAVPAYRASCTDPNVLLRE